MRKLILSIWSILSLLTCLEVDAQNYFIDGMSWLIHGMSTDYPDPWEDDVRIYLEGEKNICGYEAACLWRVGLNTAPTPKLLTYIRIEGEKVFFLADEEASDWRLLYDFGLQPGETATVWHFAHTGLVSGKVTIYERFVRCEEILPPNDLYGMEQMRMSVLHHEDLDNTDNVLDEGLWLKGIGTLHSPIDNTPWNVDGYLETLLEAKFGSDILYRNPEYTNVALTQRDSVFPIKYEIGKGFIRIYDAGRESSIRLYSLNGQEIHAYDGDYTSLPSGIYFITTPNASRKVFVP